MATYVIGDVQGCFDTLKALLKRCAFDPQHDRLWFAGDLVNRGPRSLDVLRYLKSLGDRVIAVLGNHDLHLLSRHAGIALEKPLDTLEAVLAAPDVEDLMDWLANRPLMYTENAFTLVHAGLLPTWTISDAANFARDLEAKIRDKTARRSLLNKMDYPPALRALTTLRTCFSDGTFCKYNGAPETAPPGCVPWFAHPERKSRGEMVIFGHWSALGYRRGTDYMALDTGCVWGQALTGVRLEDGQRFTEPARELPAPVS